MRDEETVTAMKQMLTGLTQISFNITVDTASLEFAPAPEALQPALRIRAPQTVDGMYKNFTNIHVIMLSCLNYATCMFELTNQIALYQVNKSLINSLKYFTDQSDCFICIGCVHIKCISTAGSQMK